MKGENGYSRNTDLLKYSGKYVYHLFSYKYIYFYPTAFIHVFHVCVWV